MDEFLAGNIHFQGHEDDACVIADLSPVLKVDLCT